MKPKRAAFLLILLLAAGLGAVLLWNGTHAKRTYVLGVIGNFKGRSAQIGVESFNAILLAYEEYREAHPGGFELRLLPVDDSWDATRTRSAYLSCADEADLLILLTGSSLIMLIHDDILERPDKVHALLGPTTTRLSGQRDNIVRNMADLEQEQKLIAAFVAKRNIERLLIVVDDEFNAEYTVPAAQAFQAHAGIPQIDVARFSAHLMDTEEALEHLRQNRYDAMYAMIGGMPREAGILIQQARAIQPDIPVWITPWVRGLVFEQALGNETGNILMPSHVQLTGNPAYDRFAEQYRQMFGAESKEYFVPLMHDLARSVFTALDRAGSAAAADLLPVLLAGEYQGTAGAFRYDESGDADSQLHFYEMTGGTWQYVASEPPSPTDASGP
jgi:ABC-type branched-subunit amino acid transport system substrate-binding protein